MPEPVIATDQLTKRFGDFTAVDAVSFEVFPGEVVGYLGPNGCGKTTTIRMLLGLLLPSAGNARVMGFDIRQQAGQVRAHAGYMSQKFALYDELTVWENLEFYAGVYGVQDDQHLKAALDRVGILDKRRERAGELPVGWRQRLALATAIIHKPSLLFLDEPTSGVDPLARRVFWDLIYELVEEGITAFVTTHYMDEAEYCQRVGIMRAGRLLAMDTPRQLKQDVLAGEAWDVGAQPLLTAMSILEGMPGVLRVALSGNQLRLITEPQVKKRDIRSALNQNGLSKISITRTTPDLEDVFLTLARR
jgi:ABC-2 type transport system ATP-binding protein